MELSTKFSLPQIDISPTISTDNLIDEGSNESETNESRTHLNRNSQSKPMPKATTVCFSDLFSSICESNSSGSDSQEDGHLTMTTKFTKRKLRPTRCQSSQNLRTSYYQVCSQLDLQSPTEEMDNHQRMLNIPARLTHRYTQS